MRFVLWGATSPPATRGRVFAGRGRGEQRPASKSVIGFWRIRSVFYAAVVVCLIGYAGCSRSRPTDRVVLGGSKAESHPGLSIYSGSLSIKSDATGVLFGPTTKPGVGQIPRYLALLKYAPGRITSDDLHATIGSDGIHANSGMAMNINGKKIAFDYEITGDPSHQRIVSETLTLNGKPVRLEAGSLLLVDLTGSSVTYRQVQTELPTGGAETDPDTIERTAQQALDRLKQQSPTVREFVP